MMKRRNVRDCTLLLLLVVCIVGLVWFFGRKPRGMPEEEASEAFRLHVLSPIPTSVTNIKADQPSKFLRQIYTFRFNMSREDLPPLIDSGPFIRIWNVRYRNGCIAWGWDRSGPLGMAKIGHDLPMYRPAWKKPREPAWFKPGRWENPEAYGFFEAGNLVNTQALKSDWRNLGGRLTTKLLLYNEKEGEAYFVVSSEENR
jgi:hypothetical protein